MAFPYFCDPVYAEVAQLVERNLAKVEVAGSSLVFRSKVPSVVCRWNFLFRLSLDRVGWVARVAELVDAQDLKSCFPQRKYGFDSRPGHNVISTTR